MEYHDIYDKKRNLTGRVNMRGDPMKRGEYGLIVCVWVADGQGNILLTRRAPEKSFPGTWENSGGMAQAGENSRQAIARELFEETGIVASPEEFTQIATGRDRHMHYDFYTLVRDTPISKIKLLPGETDDVRWASFAEVSRIISQKQMCAVIARQFYRQRRKIPGWQTAQKSRCNFVKTASQFFLAKKKNSGYNEKKRF